MEKTKKPERNALLDVLKVIFTIFACFAHFNTRFWSPFNGISSQIDWVLNPAMQQSYIFKSISNPIFGFMGYRAISFFTFTTGYWFVNAFKRSQRQGIFGKGKDFTIVSRYWARNYAAYWPYVGFGTLWAILFTYAMIPPLRTDFMAFITNLLTSVPQLLGVAAVGMGADGWVGYADSLQGLARLTENFTISPRTALVAWNGPLWYMFALIVIMGLVYFIFMKSETFGIYGFCPLMLSIYYASFCAPNDVINAGWGRVLDHSILRLCGPMAWGILGWYVTDWLKKQEFSKKGKAAITAIAVFGFAAHLFERIFAVGGFVGADWTIAVFLVFVLAQKDYFTVALNKFCSHIPGLKFAGPVALGMYIMHYPICNFFGWLGIQNVYYQGLAEFIRGFSINQLAGMYILLLLVLMIPFYFIDKYCLKNLTKWVTALTKAGEPVVIEEKEAK